MLNVKQIILMLALFGLVLVACGGDTAEPASEADAVANATAEPTATASPTDAPTATAVPTDPPTATPTDAPTAEPTATAEPTPTPVPPTAEPEPTNTPAPTATPTPIVLLEADDFAEENRSPYTGLIIEDEAIQERRAIICKTSNSPQEWVRPQSGLNSADIIVEHLAEGVTRFSQLFHSTTPELVGPVRSARLIDIELARAWDAGLCFSGASIGVSERLETSDIRGRLIRSYYDGYFRNEEIDKPFEHTFYARPELFWAKWDEIDATNEEEENDIAEINRAPDIKTQMAFTDIAPEGGTPTESVVIDYRKFYEVEWQWDETEGQWLRWGGGTVYTDTIDMQQVAVSNVILLSAVHKIDESICDWQLEEVPEITPDCRAGGLAPELIGKGDLVVLRDGMRYEGYWQRENKRDMFTFFTEDDEPLPLQLGQSWIQMIPYYYNNPVEFVPSAEN